MATERLHILDDGRAANGVCDESPSPAARLVVPEGMKRCPKCGEAKPLSGFNVDNRKKSGVQSRCRPCQTADKQDYRRRNPMTPEQKQREYEAHIRYRDRNREMLRQKDRDRSLNDETYRKIRLRGNQRSLEKRHERSRCFSEAKSERGCFFCGERESCALDLHHVNPEEKDFPVGNMFGSKNWTRVIEEAAKCVVLCANCHRKHHDGLLDVPADAPRLVLPVKDPGAAIHIDGRKNGARWAAKRYRESASATLPEPSNGKPD